MVPRPRPKSALDLEAETIEEEISLEAKRRAEKITSLLANWLINGE